MVKKMIFAILVFLPSWVIGAANTGLRFDEPLVFRNDPIKLVVKIEKSKTEEICQGSNSRRWGSEYICPNWQITQFDLSFEEKPVFIPYSAFSDLGDPTLIQIEKDDNRHIYLIKIEGGDATTSYRATLKFQANLLLERIVRHSEFPDDAWEKTIYKFNTDER